MRNAIIVEGPDGTGKSTVASQLLKDLDSEYITLLRDPGATPLGEKMRALVLDPEVEASPLGRFYMFMAARAEVINRAVQAVDDGHDVIFDRLWPSTYAYQGWGEGIDTQLIANITTHMLEPLVQRGVRFTYVILSASPENRKRRMVERKLDHFESKSDEYKQRVAEAYEDLPAVIDRITYGQAGAVCRAAKVLTINTDVHTPWDIVHHIKQEIEQYGV